MNIQQIIATATRQVEAHDDKADFPVPGDFDASVSLLIFNAGVEAMRVEVVKILQTAGLNGVKNQVNDIVI